MKIAMIMLTKEMGSLISDNLLQGYVINKGAKFVTTSLIMSSK